jgi:hypothetical protein
MEKLSGTGPWGCTPQRWSTTHFKNLRLMACPFVAQTRRAKADDQCRLSRKEQTSKIDGGTFPFDPFIAGSFFEVQRQSQSYASISRSGLPAI